MGDRNTLPCKSGHSEVHLVRATLFPGCSTFQNTNWTIGEPYQGPFFTFSNLVRGLLASHAGNNASCAIHHAAGDIPSCPAYVHTDADATTDADIASTNTDTNADAIAGSPSYGYGDTTARAIDRRRSSRF